MYGGTVSCDALGDAIHCDSTGNLNIYNGTVSAYYEAVNVRAVIIAVLLFAASIAHQKLKKQNISPILLIVLSALLGILIF